MRDDDDLYDLSSVETEFPAIVINNDFATQDALSCKSQVSAIVNEEIDFRISFDESDDEDYTIIYDANSFSYKMISVNDLKTDSENDYEKVMPLIPSPEPAISCFDDLDFFNDFENKFPAIVYNDAQKSKSDLFTEPILNPYHINEFSLNDKSSLSEYDEEKQNVLYFNDLFPFNIVCSGELNSEKDNDNNEIDMVQPFENNKNTHGSSKLFGTSHDKNTKDMAPLPPREHRHRFLRYEGLEYTAYVISDFESRLERIHMREVHRVPVFNFEGLPDLMSEGLTVWLTMGHRDKAGVSVFTSQVWRRMLDIRGPLVHELILEFFSTFRRARQIPDKGDLRDYWRGISSAGDFLDTAPSYTLIRDPIMRLCHRLIACSIAGRSQAPKKVTVTDLFYLRGMDVDSVNVPYLLARYLRMFTAGRKSGAHISGGQFVTRLVDHFGLLTAEILGGLTVIAPELPVIDMAEQPDAAVGSPAEDEDAPIVDEGGSGTRTGTSSATTTTTSSGQDHGSEIREIGGGRTGITLRCRHSTGLFVGAHLLHLRDGPDRGLARPALPQLSRALNSL
ncbi:hypothetical protein Tco_0502044, partial [Tanacetum coccineum]